MKKLNEFYTNEVSPEYLRTLDNSPFTEQQLAGFCEEALAIVNKQRAYVKAHPPIAIYRIATEGSQTRNGGVIQQATSPLTFKLGNGQEVRGAQKGDFVVYTDGSTAQIMTGAGHANSDIALVGSYLSNGDEIINTPQGSMLKVTRKGVTLAKDFLPAIED
ncbi:MAG: hypothetical protein JWP80_815 [Pseudomonas sp.]|nr:hypothetical protein [Pseudomonas sp.]